MIENSDGLTLAVGGTALGAICTLLGSWIKARYGMTRISPNPLRIASTGFDKLVMANENEHRNLFDRVKKCENALAAIQERTIGLNQRLERIENKLDRLIEGQRK